MYKLYTDGSCLNRFALGGIGGYILDEQDNEVLSFSEVIYKQIKLHETQALLCGLKIAKQMGITEIQCYSDDKSLEEKFSLEHQKKQRYYSKHNEYLKEAFELSKSFASFNCTYLPREENKKADTLSRLALVKKREKSILGKAKNPRNKQPYDHLGLKTYNDFNFEQLSKLTQKIKYHFIFTKKKSEDKTQINVHLVSFSTDKDYVVENISNFDYHNDYKDTNAFMIGCINQVLKEHIALKTATLTISGTLVENILSNNLKAYKKQLINLAETIHDYEMVCLYTRPLVKELIINNMKKPNREEMIDITKKENLLEALTIVSDKNYSIENNDIYTISANYYAKNKFENVEKIQKYYFHQIVRLNINAMRKCNEKPDSQKIIEHLKEELKEKNIHLNF
jgi:ribonuclease HI